MSIKHTLSTLIASLLVLSSTSAHAATSPNRVRGFVYEWFGLFDENAPTERFLERLDDHDLRIEFPERTLTSQADFADWYGGILATYKVATHDLKKVDVAREGSTWSVDLVVNWKAEAFDGSHAELLVRQKWTVVETADGGLLIRSYIVRPVEAPAASSHAAAASVSALSSSSSSSNLTCTCHGGPGNYAYACAPIQKTCYGGPGNYPYACSVCPEG